MARKVNINTFNPQAGVSIPGWATESYKQTIDTLGDVVSDVTGEVKQARKDNMAFALESSRIAQRDREFEYKKDLDDFNIAKDNFEQATIGLTGSSEDIDVFDEYIKGLPATDNPRLQEFYDGQRELNTRRKKDYNITKDNIRNLFLGGMPDAELEESGLDTRLDSWTMQYFKDPSNWNKYITEYTFKQRFPEYNPDYLTQEKTKAVMRTASDILPMLLRAEPGSKTYKKYEDQWNLAMGMIGDDAQAGIDFSMSGNMDSQYAKDTGQTLQSIASRREQDSEGLDSEMNSYYSGGEEQDKGTLEGLGDFIESVFSDPAGDVVSGIGQSISDSGLGTIGRFLNREEGPLGTVGRYLSREDTDLSSELDKAVGSLGGGLGDLYTDASQGLPAVAETLGEGFKALPDVAKETYADFALKHPNITSGLKGAGLALAATNPITASLAMSQVDSEDMESVKQFSIDSYNKAAPVVKDMAYLAIDKVDESMLSGLKYATEKFTGAIETVQGARGPKMALRRGMEVMSTLPHRAIEFFNLNRNPAIDKYVEQGMSFGDATEQAYKDAVANGGQYFTTSFISSGEGAPPKHIYKKTLVDYATNKNLGFIDRPAFKKSEVVPESIKNAPGKFVSPRWIAWKTNNLEKDLYAQYAKITDAKNQAPALAAKSMMNVKNKSSELIKDLRKIKSDIVSAPKISKGELTVSPKVIDELINRAQRLTASKSALNAWDNFMKGAPSDFDLEKEIGLEADDIAKEFEFEALLDSLQGAPSRFDFETYQYPFPIYKSDN